MRNAWTVAIVACLGVTGSGCSTARSPEPVPLVASSEVEGPAVQQPPESLLSRTHTRLHTASVVAEGLFTTDNLAVAAIDRFALGYQRLGEGTSAGAREAFGTQIPLGVLSAAAKPFEVYGHYFRAGSVRQHEAVLAYRPSGRAELMVRRYDVARGEGTAVMALLRRNASLDASDNLGAGGFVDSGPGRGFGAYGWARIKPLDGFFLGLGRYPDDSRYVLGLPKVGGVAVRYFGLRARSGFQLNEVLFSRKAVYLKPVDFYSTLIPIKGTDSLIANGGVFAYQVPPISARGSGLTMGLVHRKFPGAGDFLEAEAVTYRERIFVGLRYSGRWNRFDTGVVGIPIGYQFSGGDGLTRNFIRIVPEYDQTQEAASVAVLAEWKR